MTLNKYTVYKYTHPTTKKALYIGITNNPQRRHAEHSRSPKSALFEILKELREQGLDVIYEFLATDCDLHTARWLEKHSIKVNKPLLNIVSNKEARSERHSELIKNISINTFAEEHNLTISEAMPYYEIRYKLYDRGEANIFRTNTPHILAVVTDAVRGMEEAFHIKQPLTNLELIRFTYYVKGLSEDPGVQRPENATNENDK